MEGYQERMAQRIRQESAKRGERAADLAYAMGVHPSTVERWLRAERLPQRRHRKELAEHWGLPFDVFEFDLEAEERGVREQLDRIESKVDEVLAVPKRLDALENSLAELLAVVSEVRSEQERQPRRRAPAKRGRGSAGS